MKKETLSLLGLAGVAGPVLFSAVVLVSASLRPDYSHFSQFISELGATGTPHTLLMNFGGFILSGMLIALFGIGLRIKAARGLVGRIGAILILFFGIGMMVVGIFSCDIGCPTLGTLENNIHDQVSGPAFISAILGILLTGISFRKMPAWRGLWLYSVLSAIIAIGLLVGLISSIEARTSTGLWQRLLIILIFLWCAIVGWKIYKSSDD